jgi:hypothetical protein
MITPCLHICGHVKVIAMVVTAAKADDIFNRLQAGDKGQQPKADNQN